MPYQPKTGRTRGLIFAAIRLHAARHATFTVRDLPFPNGVAHNALIALVNNCELTRIRPATRGRWATPALYRSTANLSPVTPRPHGARSVPSAQSAP